jgi:hypothetical protein
MNWPRETVQMENAKQRIRNPNCTVTFCFGRERTMRSSAKCDLLLSASAIDHSNAGKIRTSFHRDGASRRGQAARHLVITVARGKLGGLSGVAKGPNLVALPPNPTRPFFA